MRLNSIVVSQWFPDVSLREGGFYLSRCGVATWARDPGIFWEAPQTPAQPNQCPWPKICPHSIGECLNSLR